MKDPVASLEVVAVTPDGKRLNVTATIHEPFRDANGSWVSQVQVAPLHAQVVDVRGVDSFHAVWLACSLILKLLEHLKSGGGQLLNADGTEFPLQAYLSGPDGKPK